MTPEYLNVFSFVSQIGSKTTRSIDSGSLHLPNFALNIISGLFKYMPQCYGINCPSPSEDVGIATFKSAYLQDYNSNR